jgi:hypothetical protein
VSSQCQYRAWYGQVEGPGASEVRIRLVGPNPTAAISAGRRFASALSVSIAKVESAARNPLEWQAKGEHLVPADDKPTNRHVCADCFGDDPIRRFVRDHVVSGVCDFCGRQSDGLVAAPWKTYSGSSATDWRHVGRQTSTRALRTPRTNCSTRTTRVSLLNGLVRTQGLPLSRTNRSSKKCFGRRTP